MMQQGGLKNIGNHMNKQTFEILQRLKYILDNRPHIIDNVMNSYRENQYTSKQHLISTIESLGIFDEVDNVVVLACWYGAVLFPLLSKYCNSIIGYDMDANCRYFNKVRPISSNAAIKTSNIWLDRLPELKEADLIINTSCEHMPPMKYWDKWDQVMPGTFIAFQSNDMIGVKDHVNSVKSLTEFKNQMPDCIDIISMTENDIMHKNSDKRSDKRFTIIGQI